jgi:hypothetical protein
MSCGTRRFIAAICIAAVIFAAVTPAAAALFCAVLVPLPPLFGTVMCAGAPSPESISPEPFPLPAPLPSRAPPVA